MLWAQEALAPLPHAAQPLEITAILFPPLLFAVAVQALAPQEHTRAPAAATVVHAAYLTLPAEVAQADTPAPAAKAASLAVAVLSVTVLVVPAAVVVVAALVLATKSVALGGKFLLPAVVVVALVCLAKGLLALAESGQPDAILALVVTNLDLADLAAPLGPLVATDQGIVLAATGALTAEAAVAEVLFTTSARVLTALFLAEAMEDLALFVSCGQEILVPSPQLVQETHK